jgi:aminoglycoside phosphotransferase (APT) family kinase protein
MGGFEAWLRDHHGRMATPRDLIAAKVREATGSAPASLQRLLIGQDNEVYDAAIAGGAHVMVRISHAEEPRFEGERWALDAARAAGVPTPRVLLLDRTPQGAFCIEEKLPGTPLDVVLERGEWPGAAIEQLGALLAAIHGVPVEGFGYLQPDGRAWPGTFAEMMLHLPDPGELASAAVRWGIPVRQVERGLELLADHRELYRWDTPRLVHGDFTLGHILVDGDRVSGILDMQECFGGHPIWDLMMWDSMSGQRIRLPVLLRSYGDSEIFDATYQPLFHLSLVRRVLYMLVVHHNQHNPYPIEHYRRELQRGLGFFGA